MPIGPLPRPRPARIRLAALALAAVAGTWGGQALPMRHLHAAGDHVLEHVHLVLGGHSHHRHAAEPADVDALARFHGRHPRRDAHLHPHPGHPHSEPASHPPGDTHGGHDDAPASTLLPLLAAQAPAAPPRPAAVAALRLRLAPPPALQLPASERFERSTPRGPPIA